jgi:phosphoribosyl 1,2-cyclic phosphodiesterase/CheY-like chemotaxis protein
VKKIVVVDDDQDMRAFLVEALSPSYSVTSAEDGVLGLELVKNERPDLVILDLLMPRMHGFEVCKRIKEDSALKDTKVLISSSKSYAHDQSTAQGAGADKYLVKPYQLAELTKVVDDMIGGARTPLQLKFWGTRGSIPSPGRLTERFGGNTPCTELRCGDLQLVIDAGTGLRELGNHMMKEGGPQETHLLVGHTHWDHIQGLPFFTPAYVPDRKLTLYGVHGTTQPFSDVLSGQMSPSYFPVSMRDMLSRPRIVELSGPLRLGDLKITYHYLNHPGITVGFRIEARNWTVCYISDHEPYGKLNNKGEFSAKEDDAVAKFVEGADILISEAQYTDEEYRLKRSWGHSAFSDVLALAAKAKVKQLALFHHDPAHTDDMMDRFVKDSQDVAKAEGHAMEVLGAREGMILSR